MKNLFTLLLLALFLPMAEGQEVIATVNQKISGKSAIGKWIDYSVDPATDKISFSFETKRSKKLAKFEHYTFDLGLDYKGMTEEEITLEKMKKRFRLFAFGGGDAPLLRVRKNWASGQLIMETGHISYGYAGRALITNFVVATKNKPKGDDGSKLLLLHSRTESPFYYNSSSTRFFGQSKAMARSNTLGGTGSIAYNEGDVCAIVYEKTEPIFQNYAYVVYDVKSIEKKLHTKITFDKAYRPTYVRDMPNGDMALIFAPVLKIDLPKTKKAKALNVSERSIYKYVRINQKGERVDEVDLELARNKVGQPYTLSIIPDVDPSSTSAYIVGYGNPDFLGMGGLQPMTASWAAANGNLVPRATNYTAGKIGNVILGKVENGKLAYLNKTTPDAFFKQTISDNGKVPAGKDAGKFFLSNLTFHEASTINGKDYLVGSTATGGNLFVTQIGTGGTIEKIYLSHPEKDCAFQSAGLLGMKDGTLRLFMTYQGQAKTPEEARANDFERTLKVLPIEPGKGSLGTAIDLLPKKHFIDSVDPIRFISDDEMLVLGHSSRKDITLVKVKL